MLFNNQKNRDRFRRQFGQDPTNDPWHYMRRERIDRIRIYDEVTGKASVDDVTWNDLNMDDVFHRINHTRSFIGEQVLYHRLHEKRTPEELETLEKSVRYYDENEEARLNTEERLARIGKTNTSYYLPKLLKYLAEYQLQSIWIFRALQVLLLITIIGSIVTRNNTCILAMILIICVNLTISIREKHRSEGMFSALFGLYSLIDFCQFAEKSGSVPAEMITDQFKADLQTLSKIKRSSGNLVSIQMSGQADSQGMLMEYMLGITLWELTSFNKIVKTMSGHEDAVMRLYEFTGELDSCIAIASFRRSLETWCQPDFTDCLQVQATDLYHPLIANVVANDADLGKYSILMGANASGKSTYMKSVAVNVILAQSIHTCAAKSAVIPTVKVMTSMAIRDDVVSGESYYVREVKYLKRMIDQVTAGTPVLLVIDEILKGTNTAERIAASESIMSYLLGHECIVLVATHDLELIQRMSKDFRVWHFNTNLTDSGIEFDYKLRGGMGGGTNAIALLKYYEFPQEIVDMAQTQV